MTTLRPFTCADLFKFNNVNFDPLTETYGLSFYTQYLAKWPEYFQLAESPSEHIMGYIMGKVEGHMDNWHGHVTALTVSPDYRRLGLAALLMNFLEDISEKKRAYFVDLFVRKSNKVAINMYTNLGYIIYRTILEYYSGDQDEDAYDMRKALSRDVNKKSVIPYTQPLKTSKADCNYHKRMFTDLQDYDARVAPPNEARWLVRMKDMLAFNRIGPREEPH